MKGFNSEKIILTAVDCIGHDIPEAFMSMVGNDVLTDIITDRKITKTDETLKRLHQGVRFLLKQKETGNRDSSPHFAP